VAGGWLVAGSAVRGSGVPWPQQGVVLLFLSCYLYLYLIAIIKRTWCLVGTTPLIGPRHCSSDRAWALLF
jgi:hypothetical protein